MSEPSVAKYVAKHEPCAGPGKRDCSAPSRRPEPARSLETAAGPRFRETAAGQHFHDPEGSCGIFALRSFVIMENQGA